jgi:DNA-binding MarR family transcriptional regulator
MAVKTHQVLYFLALCEEQSFTRAARRCGIAQPSLTRAIQALEIRRPVVRAKKIGRVLDQSRAFPAPGF